MKKLYLSCSLLFIGLLSYAQIPKGTISLGGDLSVATSHPTDLLIAPSIGWAVGNNLVLGLNVGAGYSVKSWQREDVYESGLFLRKYKYLGKRLYFFGEAGLGFSYEREIFVEAQGDILYNYSRIYNIGLGFSPGVAYSLSRRWQLEVGLPNVLYGEYTHNPTKSTIIGEPNPTGQTEKTNVNNTFGIHSNLSNSFQLQAGLRYLIGG